VNRQRREREKREEAWSSYRALWETLNGAAAASSNSTPPNHSPKSKLLKFTQLPWPIYSSPNDPSLLTKEAISSFLLSGDHSPTKTRKQRLREAILAYHPDRFVGRYMNLVRPEQRDLVNEAVGKVVRALNELMEEGELVSVA